jgi:hypothetical protein
VVQVPAAIKDWKLTLFGDEQVIQCAFMTASAEKKPKNKWASVRRFGSAGILFIFAVAHSVNPTKFQLDWPTVTLLAIALAVCFMPELQTFMPHVKSLKVGSAEIEMRELTSVLNASVTKSEESGSPVEAGIVSEVAKEEQYKRLVNTNVEAHIADLAAKDKQAALLRLSVELEKELFILHGALGLRNETKGVLSFRQLVSHLRRHGAINTETESSLLEFREARNQIAHAATLYSASILTSAIDSGIRLLRVIRGVPRETYTVVDPAVRLYSDDRCQIEINEYVGVMLETTRVDGTKYRQVFPAGRSFKHGEIVGWDWDSKTAFGAAYYHDVDTGQCRVAWSESMGFIGKANPPEGYTT